MEDEHCPSLPATLTTTSLFIYLHLPSSNPPVVFHPALSLHLLLSSPHSAPASFTPLRLSSLPLSLSSPPHQLSSSFLPFHTSLSMLHLWSFLHICLCDQKTTTASFSLNLSSPAFSHPAVLNICRMQIKSSRMTRWIRSSFPSRITGCSNSKGGSDILFLSVVYSPSLIHTHTKSWNSSHQELRQHLSACPSLRLQPSDFYLFISL